MNILILEDHDSIRFSITQHLKEVVPDAEVYEFDNPSKADEKSTEIHFDFAICDLEFNVGSNLLIPERCEEEGIPFMVYSAHANKILLNRINELGATCYVSKSSSRSEMKKGIDSFLTKRKYYCPHITSISKNKDSHVETEPLDLSKPQRVILDLLDSGLSRPQIAEKLFKSITTINNHLAIARDKNECRSTDELLRRHRFWEQID